MEKKISVVARSGFHPGRLGERFEPDRGVYRYLFGDGSHVECTSAFGYDIEFEAADIGRLSTLSLKEILDALEYCRTTDMQEEAMVLLGLVRANPPSPAKRHLQQRLIRVLKKFAFRKYRGEFVETFDAVWSGVSEVSGDDSVTLAQLKEVKRIAELRFDS